MSPLLRKCVFLAILSIAHISYGDDEKRPVPAILANESVSFMYSSTRSYYHCDFVKAETEVILRKLGAQDIDVQCNGGLPFNQPNFVEARFVALKQSSAEKSTHTAFLTPVEFRFQNSCDLHKTILDEVLARMDVFDLEPIQSCWYSSGRINYKMKVLE